MHIPTMHPNSCTPLKKIEELAQKITHEELVHYMAFILFSHPDTRWEYTATLDPANLGVVLNRTLFFPPVHTTIDLDQLAEQLHSHDPKQRTKAATQFLDLRNQLPLPTPAGLMIWEASGKYMTEQLRPLVEQLQHEGKNLIQRWHHSPPVAGFDTTTLFSLDNFQLLGQHAEHIPDRDLQLFVAEGFFHADPQAWWMCEMFADPHTTNPHIQCLLYYPPLKDFVNPASLAQILPKPDGAHHLWQLINNPDKAFD
ncbi:hypothetical protein CFELI_12940 [Corynebacterium felinum]|nr:hypothetical protein CFELI_12940 [Corynebacterium felinum]